MVLCDLLTWEVKLARHSFRRTRMCRVEVSIPGNKRRGECVCGGENMSDSCECMKDNV